MKTYPITLTVNGETSSLEVPGHRTLLELLKGELYAHSVKLGCGIGECGACTIILDGKPVNSCLVLAMECDGAVIETAEGAAKGDVLSELQQAFLDYGALDPHDPVHGQHLGILLVELGVGITVTTVMISTFFIFSARKSS